MSLLLPIFLKFSVRPFPKSRVSLEKNVYAEELFSETYLQSFFVADSSTYALNIATAGLLRQALLTQGEFD